MRIWVSGSIPQAIGKQTYTYCRLERAPKNVAVSSERLQFVKVLKHNNTEC